MTKKERIQGISGHREDGVGRRRVSGGLGVISCPSQRPWVWSLDVSLAGRGAVVWESLAPGRGVDATGAGASRTSLLESASACLA